VHRKHIEYVPDPGGRGAIRVEVPDERADQRCLDEEALQSLVAVGRRIERHFGSRQDIEWAIAHDTGELFIVQSRPVTAVPKREPKPRPTSAMSMVMSTFGAKVKHDGAD
jgi:pyruvate,water dikinase